MTSVPELTSERFWQHSIAVYTRPGVAQACLALQDNYHINVNLLLLYHWCLTVKLPLNSEQREMLEQAVQDTDPAIQEHRAQRRAAKGSAAYETLKQQELELEKAQQAALVEAFKSTKTQSDATANAEESLIGWLGLPHTIETQALIKAVVRA